MSAVTLFSTVAIQGVVLGDLLPTFPHAVEAIFDTTTGLGTRIANGAEFDVIVATEEFLVDRATALAAPPVPLVQAGISIAVAPGATRPTISSVEELKEALTSARSVAYTRHGASGVYVGRLLGQLAIADIVNPSATVLSTGFTGEALIDGRADLAIQQTSELMAVPGIEIVGPLPLEVQQVTRFSAALSVGERAQHAAALLEHLTSSDARDAFARHGLDVSF